MIPRDLKEKLGYVCKTKHGYVNELTEQLGRPCIDQFASIGFITKGVTMNNETWRKTRLADQYYKDLFGRMAFYML